MANRSTNQISEFDNVHYSGEFERQLALAPGEIGVVLDDYGDGNYEVEFAFPDGTTWLQCSLAGHLLEPVSSDAEAAGPSLSAVLPAVQAFERGEASSFRYPPTREELSVERTDDGRVLVRTPSIAVVASMSRPQAAGKTGCLPLDQRDQ
ncbi:hypothetical protein So717_26520 [Roseobacter cerasinus]|uniref:Uncharacterized protein n=2 Tax=Roseobacter cerasinus TaxID=2602289 RepID=A0A640VSA3_9RHOB|nr:hypothetical protein So717_26520 [Roseobacter cerasinus]